jgi:hypothetical protein
MTVLEALAILEAAVLECKKRDINTPEVKTVLDLLERYIYPKWLIPQLRHHVENEQQPLEKREGQPKYYARLSPVFATVFANFLECERMR